MLFKSVVSRLLILPIIVLDLFFSWGSFGVGFAFSFLTELEKLVEASPETTVVELCPRLWLSLAELPAIETLSGVPTAVESSCWALGFSVETSAFWRMRKMCSRMSWVKIPSARTRDLVWMKLYICDRVVWSTGPKKIQKTQIQGRIVAPRPPFSIYLKRAYHTVISQITKTDYLL